jgi:hypothetical protein
VASLFRSGSELEEEAVLWVLWDCWWMSTLLTVKSPKYQS